MRIAIIADTPLQVMNSIYLRNTLKAQDEPDAVDLFLGHQFDSSRRISADLKELHYFDVVYDYDPKNHADHHSDMFGSLRETARPEIRIARMLEGSKKVDFSIYKVIAMSCYTHFSIALASCCKNAEVVFYDDGIGSYLGHIASPYEGGAGGVKGKIKRSVHRALGTNWDEIRPREIYLASPGFYENDGEIALHAMPLRQRDDADAAHVIGGLFPIEDALPYGSRRLVYLACPHRLDKAQDEEALKLLDREMSRISEKIILRPHPREPGFSIRGTAKDSSGYLWELLCETDLTSRHCLVSLFSTAQFTPKLQAGKEPWVVFGYKAFGLTNMIDEKDGLVERLRLSYEQPGKILVPNSVDEFNAALKEIQGA